MARSRAARPGYGGLAEVRPIDLLITIGRALSVSRCGMDEHAAGWKLSLVHRTSGCAASEPVKPARRLPPSRTRRQFSHHRPQRGFTCLSAIEMGPLALLS